MGKAETKNQCLGSITGKVIIFIFHEHQSSLSDISLNNAVSVPDKEKLKSLNV